MYSMYSMYSRERPSVVIVHNRSTLSPCSMPEDHNTGQDETRR